MVQPQHLLFPEGGASLPEIPSLYETIVSLQDAVAMVAETVASKANLTQNATHTRVALVLAAAVATLHEAVELIDGAR